MKKKSARFLISTAILAASGAGTQVTLAQERIMSLDEVIVTAQKREQSLQDTPVAVTALSGEAIRVNKIIDVNDLSGLAPNLSVRPAVGGVSLPAFSMRGITSYGVVAGSDKQISIYLDGVYIGSPRASIFQLPDIQRVEVLRGPQGTLFGRNATGGAISITTRDPEGEFAARQALGYGNRDYFRSETSVDMPTIGDFSAYFSYTTEEQDGDIDNLGGGTTWDRTAFNYGRGTSPKTLGEVDTEGFFLSALYEPTDTLELSYKFDYSKDNGSPRGNAILSDFDTGTLPVEGAILLDLLSQANPDLLWDGKTTRPDAVSNPFTQSRDQKVRGHNFTVLWEISDDLSLKNTLAYRESDVFSSADISGTSGWVVGPVVGAALGLAADTPFCYVCTDAVGYSEQWSNELQLTWDGELATITSGLLYFESEDESGSPRGGVNTYTFAMTPGHVLPLAQDLLPQGAEQSYSLNDAESYAAYGQAEIHITDDLDLLLGLRYTKDDKSGSYVNGTLDAPTYRKFSYDDDNLSYLLGFSYAVNSDLMVYGKYSTAFVSGGSVAGFGFDPEEAESWEFGTKADFMDGRLRANLALFDVTYDHLQFAQSGTLVPGAEGIDVLVVDGGTLEARGMELEMTALPLEGLTLQATLGYQDVKFAKYTDLVAAGANAIGPDAYPNSSIEPTLVPEWNASLGAYYDTKPLFGSTYLSLGLTGIWQDDIRLEPNPGRADATPFGVMEFIPANWELNARASLKNIMVGENWNGELALWGRNLTDSDEMSFATNFGAFPSGSFQVSRSYGVDLILNYR
ncbi:TonB-dependent receptor [Haliea sp. E17]|uniref:TonB-dependent receptor n=1 Tax=Haliea sp. E17 TaxID=3401576 RepID=UPI003AAD0D03